MSNLANGIESAERGAAIAEVIRERSPVCTRVADGLDWIAAVDDDNARGVSDQIEGDRHLDPFRLERAAAE